MGSSNILVTSLREKTSFQDFPEGQQVQGYLNSRGRQFHRTSAGIEMHASWVILSDIVSQN